MDNLPKLERFDRNAHPTTRVDFIPTGNREWYFEATRTYQGAWIVTLYPVKGAPVECGRCNGPDRAMEIAESWVPYAVKGESVE